LTEETVQEKIAKAKEDSERMGNPDWMTQRLSALKVKDENPKPAVAPKVESKPAVDDEFEEDKNVMLKK